MDVLVSGDGLSHHIATHKRGTRARALLVADTDWPELTRASVREKELLLLDYDYLIDAV